MSHQVPDSTAAQTATAPHERIAGVDVARALAVFGMFTVHLGVGSIGLVGGDPAEAFHTLTRGNSSALFAFLAGVSLALMTGRGVPLSGTPLSRAAGRILVRAVALALLGGALDLLDAPVAVILTYYGGYFVLALPLLRLRARALMVTAAIIGVVGPQASFVGRSLFIEGTTVREGSISGIADFLATGYYPACTFMAFVVAGMAVGRLDLRSPRVRGWLAGAGAVLSALGYAGSWVLLYPLGGLDRLMGVELRGVGGEDPSTMDPSLRDPMRRWMAERLHDLHGEVPTDSAWWLLVATPHSGTSFEIAGAIGTSLLVLTGCMALADIAGAVLRPLAAAGAMALTIYAGHIVVIAWLGASAQDFAPFRLEAFVAGSLVFAMVWQAVFGRGPLERVLGWLADGAVKLAGLPDEEDRDPPGPGSERRVG
ncbi:heparan-alpha-glucosaminide N-acetyltransferase domain-containing protein [Allosalinactinospora lopnorensis]|uniref:heparan-alpha-glucosaminide N-acetyltransferase domain-containing protein n=1 Tax=Allosalinactinospora lopnorensis TaxID=1352348 RepID=UPI000623E4D4|nr:heparan-alpha-glucosaminide N-acetyltransferase domain-containing protein [Allosalinactinospora lopnorensis]